MSKKYPTAQELLLCWNPGTNQVALVRHPAEGRAKGYSRCVLACCSGVKKLSFEERKALVFVEAMHLIVRDKVEPMAVHNALLGLAEYRNGCADDMPHKTSNAA
jgi:hypothetical protein